MTNALFLINHGHREICLSLDLPRSVAAATLNKTRVQPTNLVVSPGKKVDLCKEFSLTKQEALDLVARSTDIEKAKVHRLWVFDPDTPPKASSGRRKTDDPELLARNTLKVEKERKEFARLMKMEEPEEKPIIRPAEVRKVEPTKVVMEETVQDIQTPAGGLEPGAQEKLAMSIPSTSWSIDDLRAYATAKGLNVEGFSKNKILRTLRGL